MSASRFLVGKFKSRKSLGVFVEPDFFRPLDLNHSIFMHDDLHYPEAK